MVMGNKCLSDDSHYVFDLYRWPVKQDSNDNISSIRQEYYLMFHSISKFDIYF